MNKSSYERVRQYWDPDGVLTSADDPELSFAEYLSVFGQGEDLEDPLTIEDFRMCIEYLADSFNDEKQQQD